MADSFNSYKNIVDLRPLIELIKEEGKPAVYERGECLLHEGDMERYISVVDSGYCRYTTLRSDGTESVIGFSMPGDIATGFSDRMNRLKSRLSIIASCRLKVMQLPFNYALSKASEHDSLLAIKMEKAFSRTLFERHLNIYKLSPVERYRKFVESYPDIHRQIQVKELASFLLITPQHLRRIRKF